MTVKTRRDWEIKAECDICPNTYVIATGENPISGVDMSKHIDEFFNTADWIRICTKCICPRCITNIANKRVMKAKF